MKKSFNSTSSMGMTDIKSVTNNTFSMNGVDKKELSFTPRKQKQITPDDNKISITHRRKYRFV